MNVYHGGIFEKARLRVFLHFMSFYGSIKTQNGLLRLATALLSQRTKKYKIQRKSKGWLCSNYEMQYGKDTAEIVFTIELACIGFKNHLRKSSTPSED